MGEVVVVQYVVLSKKAMQMTKKIVPNMCRIIVNYIIVKPTDA